MATPSHLLRGTQSLLKKAKLLRQPAATGCTREGTQKPIHVPVPGLGVGEQRGGAAGTAAGTAPSPPPRHGKKGSANPQTLSPKGTRAPFRACRGEDPAAQAGSRPLRVAASSTAPAFASLPTPAGAHGLGAGCEQAAGEAAPHRNPRRVRRALRVLLPA